MGFGCKHSCRRECCFQVQLLRCHHIHEHASVNRYSGYISVSLNGLDIQLAQICPCFFPCSLYNEDFNSSLVPPQVVWDNLITIWDTGALKHAILFTAGFQFGHVQCSHCEQSWSGQAGDIFSVYWFHEQLLEGHYVTFWQLLYKDIPLGFLIKAALQGLHILDIHYHGCVVDIIEPE